MENNKRILVIEDQAEIGALIKLNLESQAYAVTHCQSGALGYEQACKGAYDLIVLDLMLPDMSGLDICQQLRKKNIHTPILMLTAKKSEADRVLGLEVGADDYLTKPFGILELLARIKALLRRAALHNQVQDEDQDSDTLQFAELSIDVQKRRVALEEKQIKLTAKEFDLLVYMANFPGKVFTREQLLNAVWGYQHNGYEHTVNSHINRLRSKLETDSAEPKFVLTVWGVGYKFYD